MAAVANLEELPFLQLASALIKGGSQVKTLHKLWLQFEDDRGRFGRFGWCVECSKAFWVAFPAPRTSSARGESETDGFPMDTVDASLDC